MSHAATLNKLPGSQATLVLMLLRVIQDIALAGLAVSQTQQHGQTVLTAVGTQASVWRVSPDIRGSLAQGVLLQRLLAIPLHTQTLGAEMCPSTTPLTALLMTCCTRYQTAAHKSVTMTRRVNSLYGAGTRVATTGVPHSLPAMTIIITSMVILMCTRRSAVQLPLAIPTCKTSTANDSI